MPHGLFTIDVKFGYHLSNDGAVIAWSLKVTTNPGQPLQPSLKSLRGELSRIALAIQVITARKIKRRLL